MTLEEQVVNKLIEKNFHISFAESCTGGMCCGTIVNVPNASRVLDMSFVTYADYAKCKLIGVNERLLPNSEWSVSRWHTRWRRALQRRQTARSA